MALPALIYETGISPTVAASTSIKGSASTPMAIQHFHLRMLWIESNL
jgi:hypothetical protein